MNASGWVNGEPRDSIPLSDRGLQYGDGVFETLPVREGRLPLLAHHLDRLYAGCRRLGISPPSSAVLQAELLQAARDERRCVLKLIVTRGGGGRGYRPPPAAAATRILTRHAWPAYAPEWSNDGIAMRICDIRLGRNPRLAGLKHLNRLEQVLARAEWSETDPWQEGLMRDAEDAVIEGTMSNVFARFRNGVLVTPDLRYCGVAGVMRRHLLECAARAGVDARVTRLSLEELLQAEEIFVCNSLIGVWPVRRLEAREFAVGAVTRQAQHWAAQAGGEDA